VLQLSSFGYHLCELGTLAADPRDAAWDASCGPNHAIPCTYTQYRMT